MKHRFFPFKWGDIYRKWDKVEEQNIPDDQKFTSRDVLAMIIAALSIVLPWILAIVGCLALILLLMTKCFFRS